MQGCFPYILKSCPLSFPQKGPPSLRNAPSFFSVPPVEGGRVFLRSPPFPAPRSRSRTKGRLHPPFPGKPHSPPRPLVRRHQKRAAAPQKSMADAPFMAQKTQRCGCAAVLSYPGKNVRKARAWTGRRPVPARPLTAGKVFRSCRERTPHPGFFQTRPVIRDFINKYKQNIFFFAARLLAPMFFPNENPSLFPGHPIHARHTVPF